MNSRHITINNPEYPILLKEIHSVPQRLWLKGAKLNDQEKYLTIVGTRNPSNYGKKVTQKLVSEVAKAGVTIVSGLALGIDGLAHQAALDAGGKTIAIMAGGLDRIYPATNYHIGKSILEKNGTIISEYPEGTEFRKEHFVARNRIQSGISEAVLIVEAAEKSGTLITAQFALEQGRTVMAIPGNIDSPVSVGTNQLIKDGAIPVTCAQDVLDVLGVNRKAAKILEYKPESEPERKILSLIKSGVYNSEDIHINSELNISEFNMVLTMLEIKGIIHQTAPGQWDIK
jgi:DNA processing protein